jgi:hypothetical protein
MAKFRWERLEGERRSRLYGAVSSRASPQTVAEARKLRMEELTRSERQEVPPCRHTPPDFGAVTIRDTVDLADRLFVFGGCKSLKVKKQHHSPIARVTDEGVVERHDPAMDGPPRIIPVERRRLPKRAK